MFVIWLSCVILARLVIKGKVMRYPKEVQRFDCIFEDKKIGGGGKVAKIFVYGSCLF